MCVVGDSILRNRRSSVYRVPRSNAVKWCPLKKTILIYRKLGSYHEACSWISHLCCNHKWELVGTESLYKQLEQYSEDLHITQRSNLQQYAKMSSIPVNTACYRQSANSTIASFDNSFYLGSGNTTTQHSQCCFSTARSVTGSICYQPNAGSGSTGYYLALCNDPTYSDESVCTKSCSELSLHRERSFSNLISLVF